MLKYQRLDREGKRPSSRRVENPVKLQLADEKEFTHLGKMNFVENQMDSQTATVQVRAVFDNPDLSLTPGMFARVKLVGSGEYDALLINDSAVGTDQSVKYVLKVGADNKVEYAPVKLGPLVDGLRVVREGLAVNDVILVKGLQQVRPGMPVTPQLVAMGEPQHKSGKTLVAHN